MAYKLKKSKKIIQREAEWYENKDYKIKRKYGWDKNWQVYRYLVKGEKTRGLIIQNPKKISQKELNKLYLK